MVSSWVACTSLAGYLTRLEYLVKYSYPLTVEYVVHKLICNWSYSNRTNQRFILDEQWVELSMGWWEPDWTLAFSYPIQLGYIVRSPVYNPHSGLHIYVCMIRLILGEQLGRTCSWVDEYLTGLWLSVIQYNLGILSVVLSVTLIEGYPWTVLPNCSSRINLWLVRLE